MTFSLYLTISFLLFCHTGLAQLYPFEEVCSSSCNQLQDIRPPFRLKGDPEYCGESDYELICEGNHTILNLSFGKYYVTNISFNPNSLQLVDVGLASGECHLPFGSVTPRTIRNQNRYESLVFEYLLYPGYWVSFVNCTSSIKHDTNYRPVPCLSQNLSFVYAVSGYEVKELEPSCGYVAMVPTNSFINESLNEDLFQLLQRGFTISWTSNHKTFGYCFVGYFKATKYVLYEGAIKDIYLIPLLEYGFLACVYESNDAHSHLPIAIAFLEILNYILYTLIVRFILGPICICVFMVHKYFKMLVPIDAVERFLQRQQPLTPPRYTYRQIASITTNFKEKLGKGGFGSVFKGKLPGGHLVAVKMLSNPNCAGEDFISEVATIGRIHHKNVVQLHGYCSEGSKRALLYEYMPNGSLDKYICPSLDGINHNSFYWDKRNEIALGIARGIDYLHRGCAMRILHFDIKPHNILLDECFNPKVSDFGLAKLYPKDYSIVSVSVARGTIGYIAPELVSRNFGVISHKSDVYSYGMLLLEIAGGRKNVDLQADDSNQIYYPSWIYDRLNESGNHVVHDISDVVETERKLPTEIGGVERKLCKVGLWCIQMQPSNRPSMSKVVEMLEADGDTLPMPPKPFYSSPQQTPGDQFSSDLRSSELSIISEQE